MSSLYFVAAGLCFAIGLAHSVLGERYILIRLFRRTDLPSAVVTLVASRGRHFAWPTCGRRSTTAPAIDSSRG